MELRPQASELQERADSREAYPVSHRPMRGRLEVEEQRVVAPARVPEGASCPRNSVTDGLPNAVHPVRVVEGDHGAVGQGTGPVRDVLNDRPVDVWAIDEQD